MKDLVSKTESNVLVTDSLKLVGLFGREHKSIIRTIKNIVKDFDDEEISRRNFAPRDYIDSRGKKMPFYIFGEELALIITGRLTGKNALIAQLKLADEFIAMRDHLRLQQKLLSPCDQKNSLVDEYRRRSAVPSYIRAAIKSLRKVIDGNATPPAATNNALELCLKPRSSQ